MIGGENVETELETWKYAVSAAGGYGKLFRWKGKR